MSYDEWMSEELGDNVRNSKEYELFKQIDFEELLSNSPRTKEVLNLIMQGYSQAQIAQFLKIDRIFC